MPFDPGRNGGNSYNNYSNPYAPQPTVPPKKSNWMILIFALIGIVIVGFVTGAYLIASKNKVQGNDNSAVNKSEYVEVEIFDVGVTE